MVSFIMLIIKENEFSKLKFHGSNLEEAVINQIIYPPKISWIYYRD
jgi:hypothetical protein